MRRRLVHDVGDWAAFLEVKPDEQARHQRKMERHVTRVAVAEIGADVRRRLVGFSQEHPIFVARVEMTADRSEHVERLGKVFAVRALAFDQVRDGVQAEAVDPDLQPEIHRPEHFLHHGRIVEVQVGLMVEKPVPVVRLRHRVPGPVGSFGVEENDARVGVLLIVVAPHVEIAERRSGRGRACPLKPRVLVGGMVDDQLGDHLHAAGMGRLSPAARSRPACRSWDECSDSRTHRSRRRGEATERRAAARDR